MKTLKRFQIWIALAALLLPILARVLFFYQGIPSRPRTVMPDYASNTVPQPPLSTAAPHTVRNAPGKIVVVDTSHGNFFEPNEIEAFTASLAERGARIEFAAGSSDPSLSVRLKYADAYVTFSPNSAFTAEEVGLVQAFVERGGRLLVFTDPTRGTLDTDSTIGNIISVPDTNAANMLLSPYDMVFANDYLYNTEKNEANFRNIIFGTFGRNDLTGGLKQVVFYGAHSISTMDGTPLIVGDGKTCSSITDAGDPAGAGLAAAALSADGNVLAVGDFSFMIPPYNQVTDNSVFLEHIADFALGGSRAHTLTDYPFVFDRPAYAWLTGKLQLNADVLGPIADLQSTFLNVKTPITYTESSNLTSDRLIAGLLTPSDDLAPFINSFHLGLDDPDVITIPGFGKMGRDGIGVLLYENGVNHNTLIVLTSKPEDMLTLINLLADGDLSSCVIQNNIGVCSIGPGSSPTEPPAEGTPEATPVPGG